MSWIKQIIDDFKRPPVASESVSVKPGTVTRVESREKAKEVFQRALDSSKHVAGR